MTAEKRYMIRDNRTGLFSSGRVEVVWRRGYTNQFEVRMTNNGKVWRSEKLVKEHLLNCVLKNVVIEHWEVVEAVFAPTKPMNEWFDANMTINILKRK